ncbi:polymer-forming cytoskeletal protein [Shewanella sp. WXL01]|uniref:Polymer-forming cytoskeletal protein n=1 Tax=Shewanella maritima TaxID=2520507 RepID=A0A411PL47_9GAMM|nr:MULTISPECIES: polymer-forming cytoskeletal protein [Shewanella]NKF51679.1 polymer-forming cytoskeletal protein [Shewanella sp. WXL01]QBF84253.1 polymer-forming cytoskeletal protein [Shewanella maritima]
MFQAKQSNNSLSFIAQSCQVKGKLSFSGDILIAGSVEGDLTTDGNIVIESTGKVTGNIYAKDVTVSGKVNGEAHCHKITISNSGLFEGDIRSEKLEIAEDGQFLGQRHLPQAEQQIEQAAEAQAPQAVSA